AAAAASTKPAPRRLPAPRRPVCAAQAAPAAAQPCAPWPWLKTLPAPLLLPFVLHHFFAFSSLTVFSLSRSRADCRASWTRLRAVSVCPVSSADAAIRLYATRGAASASGDPQSK